jgi:Skp family chaperone for outer membrane proteins
MKRLLISASLAAIAALPSAAQAQALPAAVVAVVDLERVQTECTACKTAAATLRSQATTEENREKTLAAPIQTEQQSIQAAVDALKGKEPDAALQNRAKAFQQRAQAAQEEMARGRQQLQRNQAYIGQQIQAKLNPIYSQVMQRRGANLLVEQGATLASSNAVDVTNDVITALNAALPTIQTTAPAAPATRTNQPQGR